MSAVDRLLMLPAYLALQGSFTIMHSMAMESRRSQLLRGVLDLCLLAVMEDGPAYGYEMTKRLRARGLSVVGEGSIYPLLGRLERDGLVETYRAASDGGPPRKYYRPSSAGRAALALGVSEWRASRDAVDAVLAPIKIGVAT
jgi:PadR family transcriptional regulator PadR